MHKVELSAVTIALKDQKKADDNIYICKILKNVLSKLYNIGTLRMWANSADQHELAHYETPYLYSPPPPPSPPPLPPTPLNEPEYLNHTPYYTCVKFYYNMFFLFQKDPKIYFCLLKHLDFELFWRKSISVLYDRSGFWACSEES